MLKWVSVGPVALAWTRMGVYVESSVATDVVEITMEFVDDDGVIHDIGTLTGREWRENSAALRDHARLDEQGRYAAYRQRMADSGV